MPPLRRFLLLAALAAGAAVVAGPAFGASARPVLPLEHTLGSTHFLVHYQSDSVNTASAITETTAGDVAAYAERAYAQYLADGFPVPMSDGALGGDGRIDIYVADLSASPGTLGDTEWDTDNPQSSAFIRLAGNDPLGLDQHTIAHELFHVFQISTWLSTQVADYWLYEASAEWMGYRIDNYGETHPFVFGPTDMALDCRDPFGTYMCALGDTYANNGYSRWPFFEYLAEKYGPTFVEDILAQGAAGAPATSALAALSQALVAKGTTLADTYDAWTQADLTNSYTPAVLQQRTPHTWTSLTTGVTAGTLSTIKVPVNHLSTRIVEFDRGDGDPTHICHAATLSITVSMPAGTSSKPVFWWDAIGSTPIPLTVSGSSAFAAIPWDTCTYSGIHGYLAIPNASTTVDAADFSIASTLNVDTSTPIDPNNAPAPVATNTAVIPVSNAEVAPTVMIAGAVSITLSPKSRVVRFLVVSSGEGRLHGMIGGADLGSPALRAGNNDIRFTVPVGMLQSLRRSAANDLLTLTAISPQGTETGASVTRRIVVAKPPRKTHR